MRRVILIYLKYPGPLSFMGPIIGWDEILLNRGTNRWEERNLRGAASQQHPNGVATPKGVATPMMGPRMLLGPGLLHVGGWRCVVKGCRLLCSLM